MTTLARIDQLISRLEAFAARPPLAQDAAVAAAFETSLAEASARLDAVLAQNPGADRLEQALRESVSEPEAASFLAMSSQDWLKDSEPEAIEARPNMRDFMAATGVEAADASELLYGVIGSNADLRDWSKIMASDHPVDAARAATAQMYNSDKDYALVKHQDYRKLTFDATLAESSLSSKVVVEQQGNFATIAAEGGHVQSMAVSSSGLILRGAGSTPAQIERTAWLFGFDAPGLAGQS